MASTKQREYITAISIDRGIITLIEPDGSINYYRQRGMNTIPVNQIKVLIAKGLLDPNWKQVKELPKHYSISYEDEEIMGKARATYPFVPRNRVPNGTKPAVNKHATSKKGTK